MLLPGGRLLFADSPALHLPPVKFRRCVFDGWGFDVTCFFTVEDARGDGRRYPAALEHGEHWAADDCSIKIGIIVSENRRVGPGSDLVQSIAGLMHDPGRIDIHEDREDRAMRWKMFYIPQDVIEWKVIVPF